MTLDTCTVIQIVAEEAIDDGKELRLESVGAPVRARSEFIAVLLKTRK